MPRPDVVEISVGSDDGMRKGHKFVVTRPSNGKYIGIIEVIQVDDPSRAVCRPDKATQNDQIQKGDRVQAYIPKVPRLKLKTPKTPKAPKTRAERSAGIPQAAGRRLHRPAHARPGVPDYRHGGPVDVDEG